MSITTSSRNATGSGKSESLWSPLHRLNQLGVGALVAQPIQKAPFRLSQLFEKSLDQMFCAEKSREEATGTIFCLSSTELLILSPKSSIMSGWGSTLSYYPPKKSFPTSHTSPTAPETTTDASASTASASTASAPCRLGAQRQGLQHLFKDMFQVCRHLDLSWQKCRQCEKKEAAS